MSRKELDQEWVKLIAEARDIGISKETISLFLKGEVFLQHPIQISNKTKGYER